MACQLAANEVIDAERRHRIASFHINNESNIGIPVDNFYIDNDRNIRIPVEISTNIEIDEPIRWAVSNAFYFLNHYLKTLIFDPICDTMQNELGKKGLPMYGVSNNYYDRAYFGAGYDYWLRIGVIESDGLKRYIEYLKSYPGHVVF